MARLLAFYLPQFHPIPENDAWWGKGFTEWTNVAKARPLFRGHYQPHIPADLGFYDLRLAETRQAQVALAREYGIYGFCYYHYWFSGRRILERPINEMLGSATPNFPFCLCWANENWTRRWDGQDDDILLRQVYSPEDDVAHFRALTKYFADDRYIRIENKPLFLVYRASNLPDARGTVERWRKEAERLGFPGVYLCNVESMPADKGLASTGGFDAAVEFAPDWECLPSRRTPFQALPWFLRKRIERPFWRENQIFDYVDLRDKMLSKPEASYLRYRSVTPSWDNSARKNRWAFIARNATPETYEEWLRLTLQRFKPRSSEEDFVFINAWNEWGEGNHIEPCMRWGRQYLEATRRAILQDERKLRSQTLIKREPLMPVSSAS